jgi:hypothetical protein
MTTIAPGGALHDGPPRPRALLPALGPLGPVVRPVRPVLAPVLRAALPAHLRSRPFLPPKPRTPPHVPARGRRSHRPTAGPLPVPPAVIPPPVDLLPPPAPAGAAGALPEGAATPAGGRPRTVVRGRALGPALPLVVPAVALVGALAVALALFLPGRLPGPSGASAGSAAGAAVAAVPVAGGLRLLAADGAVVGQVAAAPAGVPVVVAGADPGVLAERVDPAAVAAAVAVRAGLPAALAAQVTEVGATSGNDVWLVLRGGARVAWGSAERGAAKAQVLAELREAVPAAARYDVSTPDAPAASVS